MKPAAHPLQPCRQQRRGAGHIAAMAIAAGGLSGPWIVAVVHPTLSTTVVAFVSLMAAVVGFVTWCQLSQSRSGGTPETMTAPNRSTDHPTSDEAFLDALGATRPAWQHRAACRGLGPNLFFPHRGEPTADARAVCECCPVAAQCREVAVTTNERFGIWGNTGERQRRQLRRLRREVAS